MGILHYTYNALIVATFTEVSKIYDRNSKTNYFTFIEYCQKHIDLLLQIRKEKEKNNNIEENKKVDREYLEDIFSKLKSDITKLEPAFKNLKTQRDKIYAHNDLRSRDGVEAIIEDNPISLKDMEELISCTTISLQFIYALITLIKRNPLPNNIGNLDATLIKLQENRKYKE
ncbi:transposase [Enterococcus faecalis]|uniref:AbiU2 domain-containing protein n=1 Tax=Enterococcus faecalis TaxID=1351 RepID=UPI001F11C4CC|nr:transposase [Enterococcus faecalis]